MVEPNLNSEILNTSNNISGNFIKNYFHNHSDNIKNEAQRNAEEFLSIFETELNRAESLLESERLLIKENLNSPDFAKTLEQSIKTASLSGNKRKKEFLASLVATRLFVKNESTDALILKMACEKVEFMNFNQLAILGYVKTVNKTEEELEFRDRAEQYMPEQLNEILIKRFLPYLTVSVNEMDSAYIESLGCAKINLGITFYLTPKIIPSYLWDNSGHSRVFLSTKYGNKLLSDWDTRKMQNIFLSPVGATIADHVRYILTQKPQA